MLRPLKYSSEKLNDFFYGRNTQRLESAADTTHQKAISFTSQFLDFELKLNLENYRGSNHSNFNQQYE